jgi:hypothetical protein
MPESVASLREMLSSSRFLVAGEEGAALQALEA